MSATMRPGRGDRHETGTARSGPPPDRPSSPAPPPPPRWRNWLLIAGLVLAVVLFLVPAPRSGKVEQLSYSQLKSDIAAGQVASVAIGPRRRHHRQAQGRRPVRVHLSHHPAGSPVHPAAGPAQRPG